MTDTADATRLCIEFNLIELAPTFKAYNNRSNPHYACIEAVPLTLLGKCHLMLRYRLCASRFLIGY